MSSTLKSLLFWMVLVVVAVLIWNFSTGLQGSEQVISFSDFLTKVRNGEVEEVTITGNGDRRHASRIGVDSKFRTYAPRSSRGLATSSRRRPCA